MREGIGYPADAEQRCEQTIASLRPRPGVTMRGLRVPVAAAWYPLPSSCSCSMHDILLQLMDAGTKARTVASTNMNATSSRAHTIFQIVLTQTKVDADAGKATDKVRQTGILRASIFCTVHNNLVL